MDIWAKKNIRLKKDMQRLVQSQSGRNINSYMELLEIKCVLRMRIPIRKMVKNFILITVIEFGGLNYQQIQISRKGIIGLLASIDHDDFKNLTGA